MLLVVSAVALAVLALSGAWLARYYRPTPSLFGPARRFPEIAWAIAVHRGAAGALLLAVGVLTGMRLASAARRAIAPALAIVAGVALVATGRRLAWELLGLRAVRADLDAGGMLFAAFDPTVRFVLVPGGGEVGQAAFRLTLGLHALAVPLVVVGLLVWAQRARDRPTAPRT